MRKLGTKQPTGNVKKVLSVTDRYINMVYVLNLKCRCVPVGFFLLFSAEMKKRRRSQSSPGVFVCILYSFVLFPELDQPSRRLIETNPGESATEIHFEASTLHPFSEFLSFHARHLGCSLVGLVSQKTVLLKNTTTTGSSLRLQAFSKLREALSHHEESLLKHNQTLSNETSRFPCEGASLWDTEWVGVAAGGD